MSGQHLGARLPKSGQHGCPQTKHGLPCRRPVEWWVDLGCTRCHTIDLGTLCTTHKLEWDLRWHEKTIRCDCGGAIIITRWSPIEPARANERGGH